MADTAPTTSAADNKPRPPPPVNPPVTGYPPPPSHPTYHPYQAYPYPAPPPPPYPAYPYPQPPQPSRSSLFLRRLLVLLIAVFVVFGVVTLVLWLVLRPHLPRVSVTSASVSPFNLSASSLTATWDLSLRLDNPNTKMGIYYDRIEASVFYDWTPLAETSLSPIYQGKRNSTTLPARLAAVSEYVADANNLANERNKGVVRFDVRTVAWVRFRTGAWRTRQRLLRAVCENVPISFTGPNGTGVLSGQARECDVDL